MPKAASMKIFKGGKKEIMLGARENLLHMIETSNESGIESAVEELRNLYDGEAEQPAKSRLLEGKWKLLWSKQTSENVNPFQKLFAGLAKDTNFQIVEENGRAGQRRRGGEIFASASDGTVERGVRRANERDDRYGGYNFVR